MYVCMCVCLCVYVYLFICLIFIIKNIANTSRKDRGVQA